MATTKEVRVDLAKFETIQAARFYVDDFDPRKISLVICGQLEKDCCQYLLPLIDRWTNQFPGRVLIGDFASDSSSIENLIKRRLPEAKPKLCWSGKLFYGKEKWTVMEIFNPINPDRLPISEEVHILCALSEEQLKCVPLNSVRPPTCIVQDTLLEFDKLLVISPSSDSSDCRLFIMTLGRSKRDDGQEYSLHPIQSPSLFSQMYRSVMEQPRRGQAVLDKPFMLRAQAVGTELILKSMDEQSLATVRTKKQLNVMKTVAAMEARVLPFFENLKLREKESDGSKKEKTTNFESGLANKRIKKLGSFYNQSAVNEIMKQLSSESGSVEESVYSGKRFRRLLGTSYNSHKWAFPSQITRDQLVAGPLLSEVLGELL